MRLQERIRDRVEIDVNGCWRWQLAPTAEGYGRLSVDGVQQYAHRVSFQVFVGPIPDGFTIDHLCRVRDCVNPDHLEATERGENVRRGLKGKYASHCKRGHPMKGSNVRWKMTVRGTRQRRCAACRRVTEYGRSA